MESLFFSFFIHIKFFGYVMLLYIMVYVKSNIILLESFSQYYMNYLLLSGHKRNTAKYLIWKDVTFHFLF